jgi:hypothetical protein
VKRRDEARFGLTPVSIYPRMPRLDGTRGTMTDIFSVGGSPTDGFSRAEGVSLVRNPRHGQAARAMKDFARCARRFLG